MRSRCMHWKVAVSSEILVRLLTPFIFIFLVAVAGSAIKWLRDTMGMISSAAEVNDLAAKEDDTGGVYFVTAFSGLLAPYWDPGAAGLLIGMRYFSDASILVLSIIRDFPIYQSVSYRSCCVGSERLSDPCNH